MCFFKDIQKVWGECGFPLHTPSMLLRKDSKLVIMESKHCGIDNHDSGYLGMAVQLYV